MMNNNVNNNNDNDNDSKKGDDRIINDGSPTLKQVVSKCCKQIDIGTAILPKPLFGSINYDNDNDEDEDEDERGNENNKNVSGSDDDNKEETRYAQIVRNEFNAVVIEHHLKWGPLCETEPGPIINASSNRIIGRYDFYHVDRMVDWAMKHKLKVKGHVLCWHVTSPSYLQCMSSKQVKEELKRHIYTTVGRYRGRIQYWDVVNEALAPDGSLAKNIFLDKLGPGYIDDCFIWAHDADPNAFLIYNDNKVEGAGLPNNQSRKADAFYNLLKGLVKRGVPVHGAGIQGHFNAAGIGLNRPPTPNSVKTQIRRLGELGLKVNISEMDVRVSKLVSSSSSSASASSSTIDNNNNNNIDDHRLGHVAQYQIYHDIISAALSEYAFHGVWTWGFTDLHTWITKFYYEDTPLIFDKNYKRKVCYYGLREALSTLAPGGVVGGRRNVLLDKDDVDNEGRPWGYKWMQPEEPPESTTTEEEGATNQQGGGGGGGGDGDGNSNNDCIVGDSRPDWIQEEEEEEK